MRESFLTRVRRFFREPRLEFASTFTVTSRKNHAHGIHEAQALFDFDVDNAFPRHGPPAVDCRVFPSVCLRFNIPVRFS